VIKKMKHLSQNQTSEFYDHLVKGDKNRVLLGMSNRYGEGNRIQEKFLKKYFDDAIISEIDHQDQILDFGCGPGIFSARLAKMGGHVVGVDISQEFVNQAKNRVTLENTEFIHISSSLSDALKTQRKFDVIVLVDVIHHLDNIEVSLKEASIFLKDGGKIIVFEPNLINPVLFALHLLDPNERGLLRVGTRSKYLRIFKDLGCTSEKVEWNGIVIGPASNLFFMISRVLTAKHINRILGWLSPKIFLVFRKPI
jgi:2-polyprenyl-3-methyl-5-hydroxy-6-metoxy-1,4-benzoquinol methylase